MSDRFPGKCPPNHCCVVDSFTSNGVYCKPIPQAGNGCSTQPSPFTCPCVAGTKCEPNIKTDVFISIYGKCQ
uniref:Prokineticin domain-containing protein n=1 Tax=Octopus bimaculoides TaxID=37653 RepID=A0A0L8G337_OCTBM